MITLKLDLDDVLSGTQSLIDRLEDRAAIHKIALRLARLFQSATTRRNRVA